MKNSILSLIFFIFICPLNLVAGITSSELNDMYNEGEVSEDSKIIDDCLKNNNYEACKKMGGSKYFLENKMKQCIKENSEAFCMNILKERLKGSSDNVYVKKMKELALQKGDNKNLADYTIKHYHSLTRKQSLDAYNRLKSNHDKNSMYAVLMISKGPHWRIVPEKTTKELVEKLERLIGKGDKEYDKDIILSLFVKKEESLKSEKNIGSFLKLLKKCSTCNERFFTEMILEKLPDSMNYDLDKILSSSVFSLFRDFKYSYNYSTQKDRINMQIVSRGKTINISKIFPNCSHSKDFSKVESTGFFESMANSHVTQKNVTYSSYKCSLSKKDINKIKKIIKNSSNKSSFDGYWSYNVVKNVRYASDVSKVKRNNCEIYYGRDLNVYNACMGKHEYLQGNYGLISKYAIQGKCSYISGIDNTQLSYICKNPKKSSCSVLYDNYSQGVVDACMSCKGSRSWLAKFAASLINKKIIPTCRH